MPSEASVKVLPAFSKAAGCGAEPHDLALDLMGVSQKKARETAKRFSRTAECLRCQFAPWGGELRSRLCEPPVHVRAGGGLPSPSCQRHDTSPKGGGETWLPPWGPLRPGGTLPSGSGDQALNGAHWAPAPLPAFFRESWAKNFTRLRRSHPVCTAT